MESVEGWIIQWRVKSGVVERGSRSKVERGEGKCTSGPRAPFYDKFMNPNLLQWIPLYDPLWTPICAPICGPLGPSMDHGYPILAKCCLAAVRPGGEGTILQ